MNGSSHNSLSQPLIDLDDLRPRVGVGVLITHDNKCLLGQRMGTIAELSYGFPGGHLEYGESFFECAARELREETGLILIQARFLCICNFILEDKHYVDVDFIGEIQPGIPRVYEKKKARSWKFYSFDKLPMKMFEPAKLAIETYIQNNESCYDLR